MAGDAVIEVDLKGKDVAQQSFLGIAFHLVDWTTFDAVYFRPFNFRAPEAERRSHSVQYVSHPVNTWQKLRAEQPGRFEKAIELDPRSADAWLCKCNGLKGLGKNEEALECYDRALKIDPTKTQAWVNKGNILFKLHRDDEAMAAMDKARKARK
jgi:tetratricopeptide (TPR) repeat protein